MNATVEQVLITKIKALSPQQVAEVVDFVEFLAAKSAKRAAFDRLLAIAPALEAAGVEPMSEDEIAAEVKASRVERAERRARLAASGSAAKDAGADRSDTNVALSALLWRGTPYRLLEAIRQRGDVQLISSVALLEELADVLTRPSPAKRLAIIGKTAQAVLADYVEIVEVVAPADVPRVVPNDADDDHVIAAAVAGGAELIVSGDSDLLGIGSHQGIGIAAAAEAVRQLDSRPDH